MARNGKTRMNAFRILSSTFYVALVLVLGFFAKDSLIEEFNHRSTLSVAHDQKPISAQGSIEVVFSPHGGATAAIVKTLSLSRSSILVSAYSFTSAELANALLDAKKRGVNVKIILDKSQTSQSYSSAKFFANQGFSMRIDAKHAIYHNKVMIIDEKTIITGSFNFTKAAESKNAENTIILHDNRPLAKQYADNWWLHWHHAAP